MAREMRLKIKIKSQKYDINWPRPRYGHKYAEYKMCLNIMMIICIKKQLSNIWSRIHTKVKQHWSWVEKSVAYKKNVWLLNICRPQPPILFKEKKSYPTSTLSIIFKFF